MFVHFAAPNAPPTNLVVFNETTTTLNARWTPPPGRVQNYKITYVPSAGGKSQTVSHTDSNNRIFSKIFLSGCVEELEQN